MLNFQMQQLPGRARNAKQIERRCGETAQTDLRLVSFLFFAKFLVFFFARSLCKSDMQFVCLISSIFMDCRH